MSSAHEDTRPQQPTKMPLPPEEHRVWARSSKDGKEHVSFRNFVSHFKFYDRTDAHCAYCCLLNNGKIKQQRLDKLQRKYDFFIKNEDDLFWSERLQDKSTSIVVNNASILVQEAGLKQVDSNIQRHLDRHEPQTTKTNSSQNKHRATTSEVCEDDVENHLFHQAEESEEDDDDTVALEARTSAATANVSDESCDPATSMSHVLEAQNIQKGWDDLGDGPDEDVDKSVALEEIEELEEIAEWTPAQSSPFYEIARYIYDKVHGKQPSLPSVPADISMNHKQMFEKAVDLLRKSRDAARHKEVFVLVSGIINTITKSGLGLRLSERIARESLQACMMNRSQAIAQLATDFENALYPDEDVEFTMSMPSLQSFVYTKLAEDTTKWRRTKDDQEQYVVLKLMSQILMWLEHSHFERPISEHVYVSAWSSIFNTLLASGGLRVIPGELGSEASKHSRQLTEQEFGIKSSTTTTARMARKVDQTLRVMVHGAWSGEVAIFESKPVVSDATCERQHNKSVRLNTAILNNLESHGLDICRWYPIIAETRAASADFYTIKKYEDVLGVGRATIQKCWIPTHSSQLKGFLRSGTMEALLGFRRHLLKYASEATAVLSTNPPSPFPVMSPSPQIPIMQYKESTFAPFVFEPLYGSSAGSPPSTPPPSNVKRTKPFVMFSPCKSKKTRVEDFVGDDAHDQDDDVE